METKFRKIGVLTSGGDAPGMNAVVKAVAGAALAGGVECVGIYEGYKGLIHENLVELTSSLVSNIYKEGGTLLCSDRCLEFKTEEGMAKAVETCRKNNIDGIIACGGDGTFRGATDLTNHGIPCIGIPGTIDNDITASDYSIGYDTAVNTSIRMMDCLRDTCQSHARCNVVELMGRGAGYIALSSGIAAGAEVIAIAEVPFSAEAAVKKIKTLKERGHRSFIVAVAEGVPFAQNDPQFSERLREYIEKETGVESKLARLAHVVRGGSPTARDRITAVNMADYAVKLLLEGKSNKVVIERDGGVVSMDIGMSHVIDGLYKGKLKEGELEAYSADMQEKIKAFCDMRKKEIAKIYEIANRITG